MIGVVRYDGLLDSSLSRDCRRLTHPTTASEAVGAKLGNAPYNIAIALQHGR